MNNILDYSLAELRQEFSKLNIKPFRAEQVLLALYNGKSLQDINNVPNGDKQIIAQNFICDSMQIIKEQKSVDGTIKYALKLYDGNIIESVVMRYSYGNTICVSTQVGCAMGCKFCASTIGGKLRDLTSGEILAQVLYVNALLGGSVKERQITNIVLMGCGEPLDNYENVTKFINLVSDAKFINISQRNISLSTCGIVPKIKQLALDGYKVNLTISLHASNDEDRKKIMPIARMYSIAQIIEASDFYFNKTGRRVYFEYTLVKGINDKQENVKQLADLLRGKVCHVNVINLNEVKERSLKKTTRQNAQKFVDELSSLGISATLRRTLGDDIDGACGQLRKSVMEEIW